MQSCNYFRILTICCGILLFPAIAAGQNVIDHSAPTVLERQSEVELRFSASGLSESNIQSAYLFYRFNGEVSYRQTRAVFQQGQLVSQLNLEKENITSVSYYLRVELVNGRRLTYPRNSPSSQPVRVEVVAPHVQKQDTVKARTKGPAANIAYNILSPKPQTAVDNDKAMIAITFFYEDTTLERGQFKLYLNGENVTDSASTGPYFLSYVPGRLPKGTYQVKVSFTLNNKEYPVAEWSFQVSPDATKTNGLELTDHRQSGLASGRVQLSARNQQLARSQSDIFQGRVDVRGQQGSVRYRLHGNLTSQASSRLQPMNRFGAEIRVGDWAEVRAGDFYEQTSRLTLGGQRVRGINAELHLLNEKINANVVYGRMRRGINNLYASIDTSIEKVGQFSGQTLWDTTYTLPFQEQGRGTYRRDIIGGRLSFGDKTPIQWGLNAIKVEDDTTSMDPINSFSELRSRQSRLYNSLNSSDIQYLQQNPNALQIPSHPEPKGNFIASSDLTLNFDRNRIQLDAEFGASLLNNDISGGYLTQERARELGLDLDQTTEDLLSRISTFIIVNENMSTLPFKFSQKPDGDSELQPFVPMGIFGGYSRASFNYFDHRLQLQYRWMGPDFHSLANSTIQRDLAGFNVSDQFRLLKDQLYVTLGYEHLEDNVLDRKEVTTQTNTYRTNFSWYPVDPDLPNISTGLRLRGRGNGLMRTNPLLSDDLVNRSVRNVRRISTDSIKVLPRPVESWSTQLNASITQQFEIANIINDATMNFSYLNTVDRAFAYGGIESVSYSIHIQNRYADMPLNTHIGFNVNHSTSRGGLSTYDIIGFSVGGSAFLLDDQLQLSGRLAFAHNSQESTGLRVNKNDKNDSGQSRIEEILDNYYEPDPKQQFHQESNTYVIDLNARYQVAARHALVAQMDLTNVVSLDRNRQLPNDRILEIRYVFEF